MGELVNLELPSEKERILSATDQLFIEHGVDYFESPILNEEVPIFLLMDGEAKNAIHEEKLSALSSARAAEKIIQLLSRRRKLNILNIFGSESSDLSDSAHTAARISPKEDFLYRHRSIREHILKGTSEPKIISVKDSMVEGTIVVAGEEFTASKANRLIDVEVVLPLSSRQRHFTIMKEYHLRPGVDSVVYSESRDYGRGFVIKKNRIQNPSEEMILAIDSLRHLQPAS